MPTPLASFPCLALFATTQTVYTPYSHTYCGRYYSERVPHTSKHPADIEQPQYLDVPSSSPSQLVSRHFLLLHRTQENIPFPNTRPHPILNGQHVEKPARCSIHSEDTRPASVRDTVKNRKNHKVPHLRNTATVLDPLYSMQLPTIPYIPSHHTTNPQG